MKTKLLLLVISISIAFSVKAQFPAPTNFQYSLHYFMIGDGGYCNGNFLIGPAYCSTFSWDSPDTSLTTSTLLYYKVHYLQDSTYFGSSFDTCYTTTNNSLAEALGVLGWVWVTAVYANPDGESDSSNVIYNFELPIGIPEQGISSKNVMSYDGQNNILRIENPSEVSELRVINSTGNCSEVIRTVGAVNYLDDLKSGMYIIEAVLKNHTKFYKKIIIG